MPQSDTTIIQIVDVTVTVTIDTTFVAVNMTCHNI